jgi:hypothetical protein
VTRARCGQDIANNLFFVGIAGAWLCFLHATTTLTIPSLPKACSFLSGFKAWPSDGLRSHKCESKQATAARGSSAKTITKEEALAIQNCPVVTAYHAWFPQNRKDHAKGGSTVSPTKRKAVDLFADLLNSSPTAADSADNMDLVDSAAGSDADEDEEEEEDQEEHEASAKAAGQAAVRVQEGKMRDRWARRTYQDGLSEDFMAEMLKLIPTMCFVVPKRTSSVSGILGGILRWSNANALISEARIVLPAPIEPNWF